MLLLITAIMLLYVFYYQDNISKKPLKKVKIESEKLGEMTETNYFEDVEYKGIDANGNRYLLKSKVATFDEKKPELVNMQGMIATFYFKDGQVLKVSGKRGTYNNKTNDMEFRESVEVTQADNRILADNLDYYNLKRFIKENK